MHGKRPANLERETFILMSYVLLHVASYETDRIRVRSVDDLNLR